MQKQALDPYVLGQQYNLGGFKARYNTNSRKWVVPALVMFCLWIPFLMTGLVWTSPVSLVPTLMVFIGAGYIIWVTYERLRRGKAITFLYDQGFIDCFSKGEIQHVVHWNDVKSFLHAREGSRSRNLYEVYRICCKISNKPIVLSPKLQFCQQVELAVAYRIYPPMQAAYRSGKIVRFGRLGISLQGLYDRGKTIPLLWSDVENIKLDERQGRITVRKIGEKRNWISIRIGELENIMVLRRFIRDVARAYQFPFTS